MALPQGDYTSNEDDYVEMMLGYVGTVPLMAVSLLSCTIDMDWGLTYNVMQILGDI